MIDEYQNRFIENIIEINEGYQNINTRISQEDVAGATEWLVIAAVDRLGEAVGGPFGWLTSAAASTLYHE